ncbi:MULTISPECIES: hypothetical protein [unclassified Acinetobacter]|uniref:hypothetical protein n=1 Tax=unclassified Acinetobacter TaxID=196816 RepID=UPI0029341FFD|nr:MULTISPECIES: hypothetical protein [unclassified Acinetobacter]WOE31044.1 hypothetical protein QSG84_11935 [Acinetobacter sp. SAAs470]WOE39240.1 hypothetical protein QSG86_05600 [Acinetobacter sp. SAAs474]
MRILALVLRLVCFGFALFLLYQVTLSLYTGHYILMDLVANIGTILICIDLGVFLSASKLNKLFNSNKVVNNTVFIPSKLEQVTRKLGHLGIMLIICSWIVPLI